MRKRETDVRASMTGRDNLIIILMWDVMNNRQHTNTNTRVLSSQRHKPSSPTNNGDTAKGQCISIHYMEQHITMCAFIRAREVNALHGAAGEPPSIAQLTSGFIQEAARLIPPQPAGHVFHQLSKSDSI